MSVGSQHRKKKLVFVEHESIKSCVFVSAISKIFTRVRAVFTVDDDGASSMDGKQDVSYQSITMSRAQGYHMASFHVSAGRKQGWFRLFFRRGRRFVKQLISVHWKEMLGVATTWCSAVGIFRIPVVEQYLAPVCKPVVLNFVGVYLGMCEANPD